MERERHIRSGKLLEVDFYPVDNIGRKIPARSPKTKMSTKEQAAYNRKMSIKKAVRLVNTNFDEHDIKLDITFSPEKAPQSEDEAKAMFRNYIRRIDRARKNALEQYINELKAEPGNKKIKEKIVILRRPLKYYCSLEVKEYKCNKLKGRLNWHFHLFITGGLTRDQYEDIWGGQANAARFQPERFGPEAAARYMTKETNGSGKRRILRSRNLENPKTPPPKDGKITRKGVERLATLHVDDARYWEKRYKGYRFMRCFARFNPYNARWYVSVVMYKATDNAGELPDWKYDDWITDDH